MEGTATISRTGWRAVLITCGLTLIAAVLVRLSAAWGVLPAGPVRPVAAILLLAAWLSTVRFLLLDTRGRRVWLLVLVAAGVLVVTLDQLALSLLISIIALTFRKYRPWRHLSSRRRALGFGLGVLAIVLTILADSFRAESGGAGWLADLTRLGAWSLWSLVIFWLFSLFHLAIHMRLHFLRLRPKLFISALLIGVIPVLVFGLVAALSLYGTLGASRSARARNVLESWRSLSDQGIDLQGAVFDTTFVWGGRSPAVRDQADFGDGVVAIPAPAWTGDLAERLGAAAQRAQEPADTLATKTEPRTDESEEENEEEEFHLVRPDTTAWFLVDQEIWLIRWRGLADGEPQARGWRLSRRPLTVLSGFLKAGINLFDADDEEDYAGTRISINSQELRPGFSLARASYRDVSGDEGFWEQDLPFGGMIFTVLAPWTEGLDVQYLIMNFKVRWQDLESDLISGAMDMNLVLVAVVIVMAGLFILLEIFAFFFGNRISGGIVSAVHTLHRGTRQLAAGDLDTTIDIPNEDEFGDLAASFNEMTRAVKQGREDALARERLTRELETARQIQERLLPREEPRLAGFEITGASIPSREVGGDYFDFILHDDQRIGVAIGDVSGKGMPAALLMSNLQASLQGQVIHPSQVSEIVRRVNDLMVASTDPHMFATFFYGELDLTSGVFTCTNAGHNPPLVLRRSGELETLGLGGLLLGMVPDMEYQQETVELAPGEVVLLFTDGITEAVGPDADEEDPASMFGDEALAEVLQRSGRLSAAEIKDAVLAAVANHTRGAVQSDDITLVVIRRQK